ncbi:MULTISPECIES: tripartite tricarboxylate transporter substrate-binding protein [Ramlibacter]|uniref:Tripartite tricarboxylate transporter substrate binding protein n=1 Tax=Ramlibacter aquaticus TaxID=2780094 RepID=A0ABR9SEI4_9BURK|nr:MULTISPECIES: tripartite tricarboxylate transporter substrate-binding protein [Ramlibacter]MBE7940294.1 tripartite tricarboxylate transporter substrate binding protein [Ramlibacter aquaticus]
MTLEFTRRRWLRLATATLAAGAAQAQAQGDDWPRRPVRLVVGFPGGSTPDLVARTLAEPLAQALGQPVIVDNRPGAGGNIGADIVARATDGHTLGVMINGNLTIAKLLNPGAPYDPARDLAPVSLLATAPLVLVAGPGLPADSARGFLAAARAAGDRWSYGSPGVGTVAHIGMELLKARAGIAPVHVPYPGNPQVVQALAAREVQLALLPPGLALPQVRSGRLHAVGLSSAGRSPLAPELPSLAEGGLAGFELEVWNALAAPASMPVARVARLSALAAEIVRRPQVRQQLFAQGWQVAGTSAEGLARRMKADTALLGGVIRRQGIRAQ